MTLHLSWMDIPRQTAALPVLLYMQLYTILPALPPWNRYGRRVPERLKLQTRIDAGYCLDAPECMPAGGCENYQIDDEEFIPSQLLTYRESL